MDERAISPSPALGTAASAPTAGRDAAPGRARCARGQPGLGNHLLVATVQPPGNSRWLLSHHEYAIGDPGGHGGGRGAPLRRGSLHQFRSHAGADPGPASSHRCAPGSPEAVSGVGRTERVLDGSRRVQAGAEGSRRVLGRSSRGMLLAPRTGFEPPAGCVVRG